MVEVLNYPEIHPLIQPLRVEIDMSKVCAKNNPSIELKMLRTAVSQLKNRSPIDNSYCKQYQ